MRFSSDWWRARHTGHTRVCSHMDDIVRALEVLEGLAVGGARLVCLRGELDSSTMVPSLSVRDDRGVNIYDGQMGTVRGTPMRR